MTVRRRPSKGRPDRKESNGCYTEAGEEEEEQEEEEEATEPIAFISIAFMPVDEAPSSVIVDDDDDDEAEDEGRHGP